MYDVIKVKYEIHYILQISGKVDSEIPLMYIIDRVPIIPRVGEFLDLEKKTYQINRIIHSFPPQKEEDDFHVHRINIYCE